MLHSATFAVPNRGHQQNLQTSSMNGHGVCFSGWFSGETCARVFPFRRLFLRPVKARFTIWFLAEAVPFVRFINSKAVPDLTTNQWSNAYPFIPPSSPRHTPHPSPFSSSPHRLRILILRMRFVYPAPGRAHRAETLSATFSTSVRRGGAEVGGGTCDTIVQRTSFECYLQRKKAPTLALPQATV